MECSTQFTQMKTKLADSIQINRYLLFDKNRLYKIKNNLMNMKNPVYVIVLLLLIYLLRN